MRSAPKLWHTLPRLEVATCITSALTFPSSDLAAFCERIKPDLVLLSLTEITPDSLLSDNSRSLGHTRSGPLPWVAKAHARSKITYQET